MAEPYKELAFQYRTAALLWQRFADELKQAEVIKDAAFRDGPWRRLTSLYQQAAIYWEIAEETFEKVECVGVWGAEIDQLRRIAVIADGAADQAMTRLRSRLPEGG